MKSLFFFLLAILISCHETGTIIDPDPEPEPKPDPIDTIRAWLDGTFMGTVIHRNLFYDQSEMKLVVTDDTTYNVEYIPVVTHCSNSNYRINFNNLVYYFPIDCFNISILLKDTIDYGFHVGSSSQDVTWFVKEGRIVTHTYRYHPGSSSNISDTYWKDFRKQ